MDSKDVQKVFRAALWTTSEEIQAFVQACQALPLTEVLKLLGLLSDKALAAEGAAQRNRLNAFKRIIEQNPDSQLFIPFVRALKTADAGVRSVLVEILPTVNNNAGHAELAALLRHNDAPMRKSASRVMAKIAGKSIFELAFAAAREDHAGRGDSLELAAQVGGYHAIPVLELALVGAKGPERLLALKYLGDQHLMGKDVPRALAAIARGLGDTLEPIVAASVIAYASLCSEEDYHSRLAPLAETNAIAVIRAVIDGARRFGTPRTFALLERRFRIGPTWARMAVLNALDAIAGDESLPLLVEALASKNLQVRTRAGEVLSNLSLNKKVSLSRALLWLLRSRDVNVRRMAVDVARKVGNPDGDLWPALLKFLRDEDWWVRERVMDALVDMAGQALTKHIVGYLQDPSDVVRRYAVDVLIRLQDPAALGALVRVMMGDGDWWVRERAMEAIALLKDERAIPYILDVASKVAELRIAALGALAALKAMAAAPVIVGLVGDPDVDVRLAALACLDVIGSSTQEQEVQHASADEDHRVRARARALLEKWACETTSEGGVTISAMNTLDRLLVELARIEGDDLLLAAGRPPYMKKLGKVGAVEGVGDMEEDALKGLLWPHLNENQRTALLESRDIDFSYDVKTEGLRFRANVFRQVSGLAAVFRIIKDRLLSIEKLGLPPIVQTFGDLKNGLVLVGGPTGAGKSTTLASIIDYINRSSARHIVSLEDPIEVLHTRKSSLVNQREVGTHTRSFALALRSVLREDPDVILVGEMRDLATISFAVTAAETGHLVFGTLHTVSADTSVDRLINAFPAGQQAQVRSMLAESMRAVVCQHLLRRVNGPGRVLAVEVMTNNDAISNLIRKGKCFQIPSIIATQREAGMQSMDGELRRLLADRVISPEEAYMKANSKKDFEEVFNAAKEGPLAAPPPSRLPSSAPLSRTGTATAPVAPSIAGRTEATVRPPATATRSAVQPVPGAAPRPEAKPAPTGVNRPVPR